MEGRELVLGYVLEELWGAAQEGVGLGGKGLEFEAGGQGLRLDERLEHDHLEALGHTRLLNLDEPLARCGSGGFFELAEVALGGNKLEPAAVPFTKRPWVVGGAIELTYGRSLAASVAERPVEALDRTGAFGQELLE